MRYLKRVRGEGAWVICERFCLRGRNLVVVAKKKGGGGSA